MVRDRNRNMPGAIPVVGIGELSRAIDPQIEQTGIGIRNQLFTDLNRPGDLNRNSQRVLTIAF